MSEFTKGELSRRSGMIEECDGGDVPDCPIVGVLSAIPGPNEAQ